MQEKFILLLCISAQEAANNAQVSPTTSSAGFPLHLELLFRAWASSRTMYCHFTLWKYFTS